MPYDIYTLGEREHRPRIPREVLARRVFKFVVAGGTIFLLLGQGEAIYAAPALVPALWVASRVSRLGGAVGFTVLAALVMTEVGWAIAYVTVGEIQPWITMAPSLAFVTTILFFAFTRRRARLKK